MNNNPEGTPNPLQQQRPVGVGPMPEPPVPVQTEMPQPEVTAEAQPTEVITEVATEAVTEVQPMRAPESVEAAAREVVNNQLASEPVPKDSIVEPAKKKGKGALIALLIVIIVAVIGAAVAAIVILKPFSGGDKVPAAVSKLMSGGLPDKTSLAGTITMTTSDEASAVQEIVVNFNTGIKLATLENVATATVTAVFADESEFSFDADEIHTAGGDLYLRLSGIANALDNYVPMTVDATTNCIDDGTGLTNCGTTTTTTSVLDSIGVFEVIDDEWIRIPSTQFSTVMSVVDADESQTQCLVNAAGDLGKYGQDFVSKYQANQFIAYSTENLGITKKKNTLYKISFDNEELANFINSMATSGFANALLACMGGTATINEITVESVSEMTSLFKSFYVEIDNNNNFTRVYFTLAPTDTTAVTVDLDISYPTNISFEEPESYLDFSEVLQRLLGQFYGEPLTQNPDMVVEGVEVIEDAEEVYVEEEYYEE